MTPLPAPAYLVFPDMFGPRPDIGEKCRMRDVTLATMAGICRFMDVHIGLFVDVIRKSPTRVNSVWPLLHTNHQMERVCVPNSPLLAVSVFM